MFNYAFDNVSIIHQVKVPTSILPPLCLSLLENSDSDFLYFRNYGKLTNLVSSLKAQDKTLYYFRPSNIDYRVIEASYEFLEKKMHTSLKFCQNIVLKSLKEAIMPEFAQLLTNFEVIQKNDDFSFVKTIFEEQNVSPIPQNEDLRIIAGYHSFETDLKKLFITEDTHFVTNLDLILENFSIEVVPESSCHSLL